MATAISYGGGSQRQVTYGVFLGCRANVGYQRTVNRKERLFAVQQLPLLDVGNQVSDVILSIASNGVQIVAVLVGRLGSRFFCRQRAKLPTHLSPSRLFSA